MHKQKHSPNMPSASVHLVNLPLALPFKWDEQGGYYDDWPVKPAGVGERKPGVVGVKVAGDGLNTFWNEKSQMLPFPTPWRKGEYNQIRDRIDAYFCFLSTNHYIPFEVRRHKEKCEQMVMDNEWNV